MTKLEELRNKWKQEEKDFHHRIESKMEEIRKLANEACDRNDEALKKMKDVSERDMKYREITTEEVLSAAFTLLIKLDVVTVDEVRTATKNGYSDIWNLLNEKYKKLIDQGVITDSK
ncbi:hypothetical protein [Neobacillus vireti]|uniref:Phage protein n=1 Tax=Neobacillus vireti LMG 21834 TaxID=1131730 RepID=A0AB94IL29_9BACI|nr:hypothetical protein [Neobacillus vireti]ETI67752.1 hypothetical protein BAVI_15932 [Neobacillus vireti LMG 21834]KLT16120.1 hypothetical protein AA980_19330 [Neobacillus vireti]